MAKALGAFFMRIIMILSSLLSLVFIMVGLCTSFYWDTFPGVTIVMEAAAVYLMAVLGLKGMAVWRRRMGVRIGSEA